MLQEAWEVVKTDVEASSTVVRASLETAAQQVDKIILSVVTGRLLREDAHLFIKPVYATRS